MMNKKISLSKLESFLKSQCDALRGAGLDAAEYKDYLIAMIFLKRVNDQFEKAQIYNRQKLNQEYPDATEDIILAELEQPNAAVYEFYVPVRSRWKIEILPLEFRQKYEMQLAEAESYLANSSLDEKIKVRYIDKKNEALINLQWKGLVSIHDNVGDALSIALNELDGYNQDKLGGILTTTNFNALNSKGDKILSDDILSQMLKDFNRIKLTDDNFEFPDLLGAAYEYLIKYFAETAGKKGGEFYTPAPVVELMGKILQPSIDAEICDPTVGSGGLLINMRSYVEARYGTARHLTIHGQELKDGTYKMCKMNMIFHGIHNANIQQGDTLLNPKLKENGQLRKYDIVVANPPFSQNYTTAKMEFKERFQNWTSQKKQADFMFVQHMIAVLKDNGRMAVVMPHGVLFRGGEEQRMRKRLINDGILECIIGLPPALFYGTSIPASILIINKAGASKRKHVFFINADREYKEGKNQNSLRPEDIEKISYVYEHKLTLSKYSRLVSREELEAEEYNCNIRRYVDNAPEPPHHDVQAHLKGGLPALEVDAIDSYLACYDGLKQTLFTDNRPGYYAFTPSVEKKESIKILLNQSEGYTKALNIYSQIVCQFWNDAYSEIENLPFKKDVFYFTQHLTMLFMNRIEEIKKPLLDEFQSRGALAHYFSELQTDFKSVAASGWNAELIPDDEILESQFPEILEELRNKRARKEEIQAIFDEVNRLEEGEWQASEYEAVPKDMLKEIKAEIKRLNGELKELQKEQKILTTRLKAYGAGNILTYDIKAKQIEIDKTIAEIRTSIVSNERPILHHTELEKELKECSDLVRAIERRKDELVEQSREKISDAEAKELIIARWLRTLQFTINGYLEIHIRDLQQAIEAMYDKYTVTLSEILKLRDEATAELNKYLEELGYE